MAPVPYSFLDYIAHAREPVESNHIFSLPESVLRTQPLHQGPQIVKSCGIEPHPRPSMDVRFILIHYAKIPKYRMLDLNQRMYPYERYEFDHFSNAAYLY